MKPFLAHMNPQQQQAILANGGPILVVAGPGSGKTRVLTSRIAYLIAELGVHPYHIMAVTFTNKAAREMESRLINMLGKLPPGLTLGTFHATCARLLRRESDNLPFKSDFVIYDQEDQIELLKLAIGDLNLDPKRYKPTWAHHAISNAKNALILPDNYPVETYRDEALRRIYQRYQELLLINNALDFDDLILWTVFLLENNPEIRQRYASRFEHILVDEFQDTNVAQYLLLRYLASHHRNLFAVGDADQAIYRWRGADYRNVLRFQEDFPDVQIIPLEENYRSTQAILDVAMAVISHSPGRIPKNLFTQKGQGHKVTFFEAYNNHREVEYIADTILSLKRELGLQWGDFAVMYRTNAQSRLLEEAFLRAAIPYKLVGAQRFYGRREVKDMIAYLRLVRNPDDELSLTRVIATPPRGIGEKTFLALRTLALQKDLSPGAYLLEIGKNPNALPAEAFPERGRASLLTFSAMLHQWVSMGSSFPPLAIMDRILEDIGYRSYIDDGSEEGQDRWENVMELRRLAAEFPEPGLDAFLEQVALVSDQDTLEGGANAVTLLTLHAAKGLEFPVVFISGLNDGLLPHSRSFDDPEAMWEECRLLYVGITRAKERLFLTCSQNRSAYGYEEPIPPSRFLDYIPYHLLDEVQPRRISSRHSSKGYNLLEEVARKRESPNPPAERRYQAGMRVQHPIWGEGMVLNSVLQDGDEIVDVYFAGLGLKRLLASMAHLEIKV